MADPITAAVIDRYLASKGSPLAGHGSMFVQAGRQHGVDPRLIVAISGAETSFGTYGPSQQIHNPFGWGPNIQFPTWDAAINKVAAGLQSGYLSKGLTTVPQIAGRWAPVGAANDPGNLNSNWTKNVTHYYGELGGTALNAALDASAPVPSAAVPATRPLRASPARTTAAAQTAGVDPIIQSIYDSNAALIGVPALNLPTSVNVPKARPVATVQTPDGATLPVVKTFKGRTSPNTRNVVQLAEHYLGTPYSWGGGGVAGPSTGTGRGAGTVGFDCSSFLQFLMGRQGVQIPRVTYDQFKAGTPVGKKQLQPGDAVFFHPGPNGPEHVGVFIGHGQFIEAPRTGEVIRISKLAGRAGFMGARRYL